VFASQTGQRLNYRSDHHEWKRLVSASGLRDARLHDARHTAATVLLILGVPVRTVMSIMGWSSADMATRYQHVTDAIRTDVAKQVSDLLWTGEGGAPNQTIMLERRTVAAILPVVEKEMAKKELAPLARAELEAAVTQIRMALFRGSNKRHDPPT